MFEKELERARKALRQQLDSSTPYVSLSAILSNGSVHPAYRTFFGAEVAWWVYEERALRMSNPRFDTSEAQFRELYAKLDGALVKAARFDHEELTATIDAATKSRLNFLCRPRTTLKWFIFRGEPTKPLHEVLLRLSYLHDYEYLTDGIRAWAAARGADGSPSFEILSIIEFERIVEKVDNDAILDLTQQEFVKLLEPMYEFFAEFNPDLPPEVVPTEAVIIFLDDKGAIPISQSLERLLYREELHLLSRSKFVDVIDQVIVDIEAQTSVAGQGATSAMPASAIATENPEYSEPEPPTHVPDEPPPVTSSAQSRVERFQREVEASMQKRFLERLFSSNLNRMDSMVATILEAATWRDAAARLDLWYAQHGVDPNGTIAMELAHALNQVYR